MRDTSRARIKVNCVAGAELLGLAGMTDGLRVDPEVMHGVSQAVSGAARDFHTRLSELDGQIREMLTGWQGGAGGAYGEAWDLWHRGASEVQQGLAILAEAVGAAGVDFQTQDSTSTQTVDGIYRG